MMFGLRKAFTYRQCESCESLWLENPPADPSRYYGDDYYSMSGVKTMTPSLLHQMVTSLLMRTPPALLDMMSMRANVRPRFMRYLVGQGVTRDSRIADVGSGEGALLRTMARCGFTDLWGIDPFISGDRDEGPIKMRRIYLEESQESFDVIMFNHSLEHVSDPFSTLVSARRLLRKFGSVVVRLPVLGFAWEQYGPNWVALDPPRHLFVPSVSGFTVLAERSGFTVQRVFFDSTSLQFRGSERYSRDVPLHARNSDIPKCVLEFERAHEKEWGKRSLQLNRKGRGDTAGFVLRDARSEENA